MAEIHQRLAAIGYDDLKKELLAGIDRLTPANRDRRLHDLDVLEAAHGVLSDESQALNFSYSGFALTSLPHKKLADESPWEKNGYRVRLLIEPGRLPQPSGGYRLFGVPYGNFARIILLYLQTEAVRNNSRQVELGRTMRQWMNRMGVSAGGKAYSLIKEQGARIAACHLTFTWIGGDGINFDRDHIVKGGRLPFADLDLGNDAQPRLWEESITLSEAFYQEVRAHAVPVWEAAIRRLQGNSFALDAYIWLAYRLHTLARPSLVSWVALYEQFGFGYGRIRDFRKKFIETLRLVSAVYPEAKFDLSEAGVTLHPSPAPVGDRRNIKLVT